MKHSTIYKTVLTAFAILLCCVSYAQKMEVTGKVVDERGEPMPGVGVTDKNNTRNGTVTDLDGIYKIKIASDGFLEFSFMSYKDVLVAVEGKKVLDVQMEPNSEELEKVVVIGYGTSKKSDLTGSVSVIEADDFHGTPASSIAQALQGKVAGAEIMSTTGEPGEAANILIRGSRSIAAGNQPLIVVDGIVDAVGDLSEINPSDIVSISVLKDVSSTAIYGSRGANGVIMITTDMGDKDDDAKFKINFKATAGLSQIATKLDILDGPGYAQWRQMLSKQTHLNNGNTLDTWVPDPDLDPQNPNLVNTDWIDLLSQTGVYQDYYLKVSGGDSRNRYTTSFGFHDNKGVVKSSGFKRYTGLAVIDSKLTKKLRWGLRINYTHQDTDKSPAAIGGSNTNAAIYLSPLLTTEDRWNTYGDNSLSGGVIFNNPYMLAEEVTNVSTRNTTTLSPWLQYSITKRLVAKTRLSYTYKDEFAGRYSPSYLPRAAEYKTGGEASRSELNSTKMISETMLTYNWKKRGHNVEAMAGFTAEKQVTERSSMSGTGYVDDALKYHNMSALTSNDNLSISTSYVDKKSMSVIGRANYSYKRRYYGTLTLRADGASNFAVGRKWGLFPAAAFRWSIANEDFFSDATWLNDLSLRVSAGRSGNDAVSSYLSLATLMAHKSAWLFGEGLDLAYTPARLANSNLTWETTDSYNLGLNFAVLNSRIILEADAYLSNTRDLLLEMKTSQTTGYNTYFTNVGNTRNTGIEVTLMTQNIRNMNFTWNSTLTVAHNRQIVVDAGNDGELVPTYNNVRSGGSQPMYGYKNGYPANAIWGYKYGGVWHNDDEIAKNQITHTYVSQKPNPTPGMSRYVDLNNDNMLDMDDLVYLGTGDPVLYGGFQNDFTICRKLTLGVYLAYSLGGRMYNLSELWMGSTVPSYNKYTYILNAWDEVERPYSDIPRAGFNDAFASDRYVHDASFLRLKTVSIDYRIDFKNKEKKHIKSMTVGVSGENLFLWKNYNGFDPDVSTSIYRLDSGAFPRPRTLVFNLSMNF